MAVQVAVPTDTDAGETALINMAEVGQHPLLTSQYPMVTVNYMKIIDAKKTLTLIGSLLLFSNSVFATDIVTLVTMCEGCHGKDGNSTQPDVPIIAGFSHEGFLNTMDVFRENERIAIRFHKPGEPETVMNEIAQGLSDKDVEALADYFSKRPFIAARQTTDAAQAARGEIIHKQKCEKCHYGNGADPVEDAAILAGQWTIYLRRQFNNILSGKRIVPRSMLRRIKKLSAEDIEALLHFYALQGDKQLLISN
jgi:sulfide dehydrogenase cytochrome subunit